MTIFIEDSNHKSIVLYTLWCPLWHYLLCSLADGTYCILYVGCLCYILAWLEFKCSDEFRSRFLWLTFLLFCFAPNFAHLPITCRSFCSSRSQSNLLSLTAVRWFKYISVSAVESFSEMSVYWNHLTQLSAQRRFYWIFPTVSYFAAVFYTTIPREWCNPK